jgi:Holliday junction resolvase
VTNSRQKGAGGEREVAKELFLELGMTFKRDLRQYQQTDLGDLVCDNEDFPFVIEVKRYAKGWACKPAWETQAFRAAKAAQKHPCVIYRYDGQQWRCRVYMDAVAEAIGATSVCTVHLDTNIQGFAWICREIMATRAKREAFNV